MVDGVDPIAEQQIFLEELAEPIAAGQLGNMGSMAA